MRPDTRTCLCGLAISKEKRVLCPRGVEGVAKQLISGCMRGGGVAMAAVQWASAAVRRSVQEAAAAAVGASSYARQGDPPARSTGRSVETLVVIVAAIVLAAVLAGVLARACGGRHVAPSGDDRDVEGWVERRCRSCLDSGLPLPAPAQGSSKASEGK